MTPRVLSIRYFTIITSVFSIGLAIRADLAQASVQIDESKIVARAFDGDISGDVAEFNGTTIPTVSEPLDAVVGDFFSKNIIDWSTSGGQTILSLAMSHQRTESTAFNVFGETTSSVTFTVNADATYELSGHYQVTDEGADEFGFVELSGGLEDVTGPSNTLFSNYQDSVQSRNEQFTLGEENGDDFNSLGGSLTGNLTNGHTYVWRSNALIASLGSSLGVSASGNVSLKIVDIVDNGGAVPEATSFFIWGLLGLTFAAGSCHRRNRKETPDASLVVHE